MGAMTENRVEQHIDHLAIDGSFSLTLDAADRPGIHVVVGFLRQSA